MGVMGVMAVMRVVIIRVVDGVVVGVGAGQIGEIIGVMGGGSILVMIVGVVGMAVRVVGVAV